MNIFYYDLKVTPISELLQTIEKIRKETGEKVIAIPRDNELLIDCNLNQLYDAKKLIDEAIHKKIENLKNEENFNIINKEQLKEEVNE